MTFTFKFREARSALEIDLARISREFTQFERAQAEMGRRARGDQGLADRALARWIMDAVEHNGIKWTAKTAAALDTLHGARDQLATIFEGVATGEMPRLDKVREELARLDRSLEILKPPEKELASGKVEPPPHDLANPISDFTLSSAIADQNSTFGKMGQAEQGMLRGLAEAEPGTLRKAVIADNTDSFVTNTNTLRETLKSQGKSAGDINAAIAAIKRLNKSWCEEAASRLPPDHILQLAKAVGDLPSAKLRAAVLENAELRQQAHQNPQMLKAMWEAYEAKDAKYPFSDYVMYIQRQIKGLFGEYELAFNLGDGMVLLKGPDAKVTIPGTDAVVLNLKTGEIHLLDNKALKSLDPLDAVGALTRNLPKNIAKDAAEFQAKIGTGPETPVQLSGAIKRLQEAAEAINTITAGMSKKKIATEPMQKLIDAELKSRNISRAAANAAGNTTTLSARLQRIGMSLLDVNTPLAD